MPLTKDAKGEEKAVVVVSGVLLGSCFLRNRKGDSCSSNAFGCQQQRPQHAISSLSHCIYSSHCSSRENRPIGVGRGKDRENGVVCIPLQGLHRFSLLLMSPNTGEHLLALCIYRMYSWDLMHASIALLNEAKSHISMNRTSASVNILNALDSYSFLLSEIASVISLIHPPSQFIWPFIVSVCTTTELITASHQVYSDLWQPFQGFLVLDTQRLSAIAFPCGQPWDRVTWWRPQKLVLLLQSTVGNGIPILTTRWPRSLTVTIQPGYYWVALWLIFVSFSISSIKAVVPNPGYPDVIGFATPSYPG